MVARVRHVGLTLVVYRVHIAGSSTTAARIQSSAFPNSGFVEEVGIPMVHLAAAVKVEVEDPLEDEHAPLYKRSRISPQWGSGVDMVRQIMPLDLLEEPSPLGLRLRKSPSLLDLIQMRLSQPVSATVPCVVSCEDIKSVTVSGTATEKLKASNFPLTLLRIGTWECVSRYEGDLVAKCYFAKHKLVWEVLEGGLKSKIEIQWSDITSLRATYPENGPGTLDIVMARQPLFFKETNPQPRKHTLWQATSDFTSGQAGKHRRHFLQCPQGILNKHFEKLIQCDPHLNKLSQQPQIIQESSYFEPWGSAFEDGEELKVLGFDHLKDTCGSTSSVFGDHGTPCAPSSISTRSDVKHPVCTTTDNMPPHGSPCTSVMSHRFVHTREIENNTGKETGEPKCRVYRDQLKFPGIKASISMHDLVNHIEHCISNQPAPGNPFVSSDGSPNKGMLEELTQHLLSDSQASSSVSNEKSLMSRVNSLFSLLHNDDKPHRPMPAIERMHPMFDLRSANEVLSDVSVYKQPVPSISRIESFGELLMHLPRIASLPQMMLNRTA